MITELLSESSKEVQFYLRTQIDYLKLLGTEKVAKMCSLALSSLILTIILSTLLLLISVSTAVYIGYIMEGIHLGFLIVASFYAVVGILLIAFRKHIITEPILRKVIQTIFEENQTINPNFSPYEFKSQNIPSNRKFSRITTGETQAQTNA